MLLRISLLLATFRLSVMMMLPHKEWGVKVGSAPLRITFINVLRKLVVLGEALLVSFFGWLGVLVYVY